MWSPPVVRLPVTPAAARSLRQLVRASYPLALRAALALRGEPSLIARALTPAQKQFLSNAAIQLYKYLPVYQVPLGTAQAWLNRAAWPGPPPQLDDLDRLGWPTFADQEGLLRVIDLMAPAPPLGARTITPAFLSPADIAPWMTFNVDPAVVAAYRADRLKLWESIQAAYQAYVTAAMKPVNECIDKQKEQPGLTCPSEETVLQAAGKSIRGDVRAFIFNILLHVPATVAAEFIQSAPASWGIESEVLLDYPGVPKLINAALPNLQWVTAQNQIDELTKAQAALDSHFQNAVQKSFAALDNAVNAGGSLLKQGVETAFKAVGDVAGGIGGAVKAAGYTLPIVVGVVAIAGLFLLLRK